ncbi:MAG TPA: VOC family protein [Blastocatellia bacterium]|nr:VOC family protein [Blastocatellia bacterium]
MKAVFKTAYGYQGDAMNLPVEDLENAVSFYETIMGFQVESNKDEPCKSVVLGRDGIQIGLAENAGDSSQDGCFFEVDSAEAAFNELKSNGLTSHPSWTARKPPEERDEAGFRIDQHGAASFKVFFVVAPDGLCYCLGERQSRE